MLALISHIILLIDINFTEIFIKASSLIFDYVLLIILILLIKNNSKKLILFSYWLSPIIIYTTYVHGQIDILPITLVIASIYFLSLDKYKVSGLIISLAIISKLSMLIALPFIMIYIHRKKGFSREFSFPVISSATS